MAGCGERIRERLARAEREPVRHAGPAEPDAAHPLRRVDHPRPAGAPAGPGAAAVGRRRHRHPRAGPITERASRATPTRRGRRWSTSCAPGRPAWSPSRIGRVDGPATAPSSSSTMRTCGAGGPDGSRAGPTRSATARSGTWSRGWAGCSTGGSPVGCGGAPPDRRAGRDQDGPGAGHGRGEPGRSCCTRSAAPRRGSSCRASRPTSQRSGTARGDSDGPFGTPGVAHRVRGGTSGPGGTVTDMSPGDRRPRPPGARSAGC